MNMKHYVKVVRPTKCKQCGSKFKPKPKGVIQLFCKVKCGNDYWNAVYKAQRYSTKTQRYCFQCKEPLPLESPKNRLFCNAKCRLKHRYIPTRTVLFCVICGVDLAALGLHGTCRTCSPKCSKAYIAKNHREHPEIYYQWRINHPEAHKESVWIARTKNKIAIFNIIGAECLNHPGRIAVVEHILDDHKEYWSGFQHRSRLGGRDGRSCGSAKMYRDLLRLHKIGVDITKIVQPLCQSCNMAKSWAFRMKQKQDALEAQQGASNDNNKTELYGVV